MRLSGTWKGRIFATSEGKIWLESLTRASGSTMSRLTRAGRGTDFAQLDEYCMLKLAETGMADRTGRGLRGPICDFATLQDLSCSDSSTFKTSLPAWWVCTRSLGNARKVRNAPSWHHRKEGQR